MDNRDEFIKSQLLLANEGKEIVLETDSNGVLTCLSMFLSSRQRMTLLEKEPNLRRLENIPSIDIISRFYVQNNVASGKLSPDDYFDRIQEQKKQKISVELQESSEILKKLNIKDAQNHETVPVKSGVSFGQALQKARGKMTQKQLACLINVKERVIKDWEHGCGVAPSQPQLTTLNRVLKTKLPK